MKDLVALLCRVYGEKAYASVLYGTSITLRLHAFGSVGNHEFSGDELDPLIAEATAVVHEGVNRRVAELQRELDRLSAAY